MRGFRAAVAALCMAAVSACAQFTNEPEELAPAVLSQAVDTLALFRANPDLKKIDELIPDAAGILILPRVVKGGLIVAAEAGTGVLLARKSGSTWSAPAFYLLSSGSVGFQMGLQETAIVMIIRNQKALDAVIEHQGKFGADIGVTVGWAGIGYEGATTVGLGADIVALSAGNLGVFGGMSLEGAAIVRRTDLNELVYGPGATPRAILFGDLANPMADPLRAAINPR
ncbi:MAG: lipid-binding SYLF domain-containing protein [Rhodospirillales bacterium]